MPGKGSDEDLLWDNEDEEAGEYVGCREVAKDMADKVGVFIFVVMVAALLIGT